MVFRKVRLALSLFVDLVPGWNWMGEVDLLPTSAMSAMIAALPLATPVIIRFDLHFLLFTFLELLAIFLQRCSPNFGKWVIWLFLEILLG